MLESRAVSFFSFHAGVQWDFCVPVLQGHQGLLMVEIMCFLCSAQVPCYKSWFCAPSASLPNPQKEQGSEVVFVWMALKETE